MDSAERSCQPTERDLKRYFVTLNEAGCPHCGERGAHWQIDKWGLEVQAIVCGGCQHRIKREQMWREIYDWNVTGQKMS